MAHREICHGQRQHQISSRNLHKDLGVAGTSSDKFSAGEQGLGYIYQARLALLQLLRLPEETSVLLEMDDDLDFVDGV